VCCGIVAEERFSVRAGEVTGESFRPSSDHFGATAGLVVRCRACGHASLADAPAVEVLAEAYGDAADPVSLREEAGQVETARRALAEIERVVAPGRVVDLGCWTGSFLVAARERGWETVGVEPSEWGSERARQRGLDVRTASIDDHGLPAGRFDLVAMCDVLEHLVDPGAGLDRAAALLRPGGALYLTLPDAGSALARIMGRRWWSVLPMHVQYFTRSSLTRLLEDHGLEIRSVRTHAKVFSARYYAERVGGYTPALERAAVKLVERVGVADRAVAPDFRDRIALIATFA
jgi:SAM-dependent methyltransferase